MKYLSVCSGIEAASVAWHPLGWRPLAFSEIEPFPRAVLAHHYPDVPLHGDFTVLRDQPWIVDADVLVGGTPCQAFSVAGLCGSLADARGNLSLEFVRLADAIDALRRGAGRPPVIVVYENVPGILSTKDNAFGCLLAGLAGEDRPLDPPGRRWTDAGAVLGPARAVAWRVLDAQHFGLAQRRRRVFVVASARDGFDPAAVLFEFEGVRRDSAPSREAGKAAPAGSPRSSAGGGLGTDFDCDGGLIEAYGGNNQTGPIDVATACNAHGGPHGRLDFESETFIAHALRAEGFDASEDVTGRGTPLVPVHAFDARQSDVIQYGDRTGPLDTDGHSVAVAFQTRGSNIDANGVIAGTLGTNSDRASGGAPMMARAMQVRRLTPRECERLQGFPDDYTLIPWRGRPADQCPDGPRYKALGNSMAVPCMRWIGERINREGGA